MVDCYFHTNVPSSARCSGCGKAICFACRDASGICPSCRLARRLDDATPERLRGSVSNATIGPNAVGVRIEDADSPESRALVALAYPLWPLGLLALLERKQSRFLRRQTFQALGFNLGFFAFAMVLTWLASIPWLGLSAEIILPLLLPLFVVASIFYGIKVWHGQDVRVPLISDWLDERMR